MDEHCGLARLADSVILAWLREVSWAPHNISVIRHSAEELTEELSSLCGGSFLTFRSAAQVNLQVNLKAKAEERNRIGSRHLSDNAEQSWHMHCQAITPAHVPGMQELHMSKWSTSAVIGVVLEKTWT